MNVSFFNRTIRPQNVTNLTSWSAPSSFVSTTAIMDLTIAIGILAAIENVGILFVLCSTKRLLKSSSLLIGLTIGHAFNGAMHAVNNWPAGPSSFRFVSAFYCVAITWPNLFITFYQVLPILLALIGIERLLAVGAPMWYRHRCTHGRLWILTGCVFVLAILSMVANLLVAWFIRGPPVFANCVAPTVFGIRYMIYGVHTPAVIGGVCATVCTMVGVVIGGMRLKKIPANSKSEISRMSKQIRLTKCILVMSCMDVIFVVIPNCFLIMYNLGYSHLPIWAPTIATLIYCLDSVLNIVPYILFNREFRAAILGFFRCRKSEVVPSAGLGSNPSAHRTPRLERRQRVDSLAVEN